MTVQSLHISWKNFTKSSSLKGIPGMAFFGDQSVSMLAKDVSEFGRILY